MVLLSAPLFYALELTTTCNNACPGCGNSWKGRLVSSLSLSQWHGILLKLRPFVYRLKVTGGEPTLYPGFTPLINLVRELDLPFTLLTNGRWSDPAAVIDLLHNVPQCRGVLVSLHGAEAYSHEKFTAVTGSFDETCATIRHATRAGLRVGTSTVITRYNYAEIKQIVALGRRLGCQWAVFNRYLGADQLGIEPTGAQLKQAVKEVDQLRQQAMHDALPSVRFGNCIPQCFTPSSSTACLAGVAYCTVDPSGNVHPCGHAPISCGSLLHQSIEEIWHGVEMDRWRQILADDCGNCRVLEKCHGGCRAVMMQRAVNRDPAMVGPILRYPAGNGDTLWINSAVRLVQRFEVRPQPFGYVLLRDNCVVPVTHAAGPVLDALNEEPTAGQIQQLFGQDALNLVGSLIKRGLVHMKNR